MRKFMERYEVWKEWKKYNTDGRLHHILVLLGLRKSMTFTLFGPMKKLGDDLTEAFRRAGKAMDDFEIAAREVFKNEP